MKKTLLIGLFLCSCAPPPQSHQIQTPIQIPHPDRPLAIDALNEVNLLRASKGLKPFLKDNSLTQGAMKIALYRAHYHIKGHTRNDFAFLPPGVQAKSAGCAAWEPKWGWGSCDTFSNYSHAGAAWSLGSDGLRYMHIFYK